MTKQTKKYYTDSTICSFSTTDISLSSNTQAAQILKLTVILKTNTRNSYIQKYYPPADQRYLRSKLASKDGGNND